MGPFASKQLVKPDAHTWITEYFVGFVYLLHPLIGVGRLVLIWVIL
jgi:hypothetical protein